MNKNNKIASILCMWLFMLYFAYGSNMDEMQMRQRCPHAKLIGRAHLPGYKLTFDIKSSRWDGGVADIVVDSASEVWGLFYDVSEEDIERLDRYEGHPNFYRRIEIYVKDKNDMGQKASVYEVVNKGYFEPPSGAYLDILINAANKHNFPKSYIEYLQGFKENK